MKSGTQTERSQVELVTSAWRRDWVTMVIVGFIGIMVTLVIIRILFPPNPVSIVVADPADPDSFSATAALAMAERMSQSAEWTIATILVIGSAVIGLNWYQAERRRQHDIEQIESKLASIEKRFEDRLRLIEFVNVATIEAMSFQAIDKALGNPDDVGFVRRAIDLYRKSGTPQQRRNVATYLIQVARKRIAADPTLPMTSELPLLRDFVPEMNAQFPELADLLETALSPQKG